MFMKLKKEHDDLKQLKELLEKILADEPDDEELEDKPDMYEMYAEMHNLAEAMDECGI